MPAIETEIPRYLQNTKEVLHPEESRFSGTIPQWLKGTLYTSSPGLFDLKHGSVNNWFDGYAILSKFTVDGSRVTFTSRYVQSNAYRKAVSAGKPVMPEFGTPPSNDITSGKKFLAKFIPFGPYDCTDNTMGTIYKIGSSLFTSGDTCYFHEFDSQSLETLQTYHTIKAYGMNSTSTLPLEDDNGDVYQIGGVIHPTFRYHVLRMDASNKDKPLEKRFEPFGAFPSRWMFGACPCRNFGLTQNFLVMIEMPLVLNIMKLAATYIKGYCSTDWLDWRPEDGVRFYFIHKKTGEVLKGEFYAESPFITPMIVNTYETSENEVVIDLVTVPNMDCNQATMLKSLRSAPHLIKGKSGLNSESFPEVDFSQNLETSRIHRYIVPLIEDIKKVPEGKCLLKSSNNCYTQAKAIRKGSRIIVTPESLSGMNEEDVGFDFTVINPKFRGKKYKYMYSVSGYISTNISPLGYGIGKIDSETKLIVSMWPGKRGQVPSEPVFVPNPTSTTLSPQDKTEEDDGILLTIVRHESSYEEDNFLLAVDARTMTEVGRAYIKSDVAGWCHAMFVED